MKFFRHWASASATVSDGRSIRCHGCSNDSVEAAVRKAETIAQRAATTLNSGSEPAAYAYSDRPLREEVLEEFKLGSDTLAIVSRNSYGSVILNTDRVLFADIDYTPSPSLLQFFKSLFTSNSSAKIDAATIQRIDDICSSSRLGARLYRTANGFRAIVTSREFDPRSSETKALLEELGSDPLYIKLCQCQESFRARLTPKFWRCGAPAPPRRIPWESSEQEQSYRQWETVYERKSTPYTTCEFVGSFGSDDIHPSAQSILTIHDRLACMGELPLA